MRDAIDGAWDRVFPAPLGGKSVLEVGCGTGDAALEAVRRGAAHVVGIDVDRRSVLDAESRARAAGIAVTYKVADIETDALNERFDHVICLADLETAIDPVIAVRRMAGIARERLALGVRTLDRAGRAEMGISRLAAAFLGQTPALVVGRNRVTDSAGYHLTPLAIEHLLLHHSGAFARVKTVALTPYRRLVVGDKWQIGKLLLLAGPSASGKTTLMERLERGELPDLARDLGITAPEQWRYVRAAKVRELRDVIVDKLLFHYDIMRPYKRRARSFARDVSLDIVDVARELVVATLWCPEETLRRRMRHRLRENSPGNARVQQLAGAYETPPGALTFYEEWFAYAAKWSTTHYVIDGTESPARIPLAEWQLMTNHTSDRAQ